jgi:hypothetical protein
MEIGPRAPRWTPYFALGLLALLLATNGTLVGATSNSSTVSSGCNALSTMRQGEALRSSLNDTAATNLATSSESFSSDTDGLNPAIDSIFINWSYGSSCVVTLDTVNVVFDLLASAPAKQLVVTENPSMTTIIGTQLRNTQTSASANMTSGNWDGYEFYGASTQRSQDIIQAYSEWTVPTPSQSGSCGTCTFLVWDSLTPYAGGMNSTYCSSGCIDQTGSESEVSCVAGSCIESYELWYEFLGVSAFSACLTVSAGNTVSADVSYSSGTYYSSVSDVTTSTGCSTQSTTGMPGGTPYYAEFIGEAVGVLANFGSVTLTEVQVCPSSTCYNAYHYYNLGYYNIYNMYHPPYSNVILGAVTGSSNQYASQFTETYHSAYGT